MRTNLTNKTKTKIKIKEIVTTIVEQNNICRINELMTSACPRRIRHPCFKELLTYKQKKTTKKQQYY